jgi:hypothetical protein
MTKFIKTDDFCEIATDKLEGDGIKRGQRVYIAGQRAFPISKEDPYTQRIKFFAHVVTNTDTMELDPRLFILDPNSVRLVGKKELTKLKARFKEVMDAMEPSDETPTIN